MSLTKRNIKLINLTEEPKGSFYFGKVMQLNCQYFKAKDPKASKDHINCVHWYGNRCKIEASMFAEWDKKHRSFERMMTENKGVILE